MDKLEEDNQKLVDLVTKHLQDHGIEKTTDVLGNILLIIFREQGIEGVEIHLESGDFKVENLH